MHPGVRLTNTLYTLITNRRSCRDMDGRPVDPGHLRTVVEAGVWAPTSSNSQNVRFLLLKTPERMQELAKYKVPKSTIAKASAGVVVMTQEFVPQIPAEKYIWEQLWPQNAAAAIQNMLLMATALGLASCWISFIVAMNRTRLTSGKDWDELFPEYDIPKGWDVQGLVLLGHTGELNRLGFPKGDENHGGKPVSRPPVSNFILEPRK